MGAKRTGTIAVWTDAEGNTRYRARIWLADGSRPWQPIPKGVTEAEARTIALDAQVEEDRTGGLLKRKQSKATEAARAAGKADTSESVASWFARYVPTMDCGEAYRNQVKRNWNKWVTPLLGPKVMRDLTKDDVEDVRDNLDRALDAGTIRGSTAENVWSNFALAMKSAYASRDRSLRCHATPLVFGILPPKKGRSRNRPWLYPSEWVKLAKCSRVPVEWLRVYAVALYTGLRPNEHRVLLYQDVDLKAAQLSVAKAWDVTTKAIVPPKTEAAYRSVPVEVTLAPMLKALGKGASPNARVSPLLSEDRGRDIAQTFRMHLAMAGIDRPRLFADNETEESIDFRSLRDTYATWLALADVPLMRIQRRMGHTSPETTDRYVKQAEIFDVHAIGTPFPSLPTRLYAAP